MSQACESDKYARCFRWLREIRAEMSREMADMTPEERSAHVHAGAEKALRKMRRLTPEEAKRERDRILYPDAPARKKHHAPPRRQTRRLDSAKARQGIG